MPHPGEMEIILKIQAENFVFLVKVYFNPDQFPDPMEWPPQMLMLIHANSPQK